MTPDDVGRRFTAQDIAQVLAYESIQEDMAKEARRLDELNSKAKEQRSKARG